MLPHHVQFLSKNQRVPPLPVSAALFIRFWSMNLRPASESILSDRVVNQHIALLDRLLVLKPHKKGLNSYLNPYNAYIVETNILIWKSLTWIPCDNRRGRCSCSNAGRCRRRYSERYRDDRDFHLGHNTLYLLSHFTSLSCHHLSFDQLEFRHLLPRQQWLATRGTKRLWFGSSQW